MDIAYNYRFVDGPYTSNNLNSQLNKDNPGLFDEVKAHEESHAEQFEYVLKTSNNFSYGGHTGNIIEVFDNALADITNLFKTMLVSAKTEKEAKAIIEKYQAAVNKFVESLSLQAKQKVEANYGGEKQVEINANFRASRKLRNQEKLEMYINSKRPIIYDGKNVNTEPDGN